MSGGWRLIRECFEKHLCSRHQGTDAANFRLGKPQMDMIPTLSNTNSEKNTNSTVIYKLQLQSMETLIWNSAVIFWKFSINDCTWVWSTFVVAACDAMCAAEPCSCVTWSRWPRPPRPPCWSLGPSEEPSSRSGGDRWGSCDWLGGPPLLRPFGKKHSIDFLWITVVLVWTLLL
jgi:hypothetical protein